LAAACGSQGDVVLTLAYTGLRFGGLVGLRVEDVDLAARRIRVPRSITQVGGKLIEGNPKSATGRRSIPIPQRLLPILTDRIAGRPPGAPAVTSPKGALLGLENWKRSTGWPSSRSTGRRCACTTCGIPTPRWPGGPAGRRGHSAAAEDDGPCLDHRDRPRLRRSLRRRTRRRRLGIGRARRPPVRIARSLAL
jgi:integrase